MLPTIAIVGRPNVGKSTLFNVLTQTREALVADQPGLTRDRKFGKGKIGGHEYLLVDTGGLGDEQGVMTAFITQQTLLAVQEADCVLFLVDGRSGLTSVDQEIAEQLRTFNTPLYLVVNKVENIDEHLAGLEFHKLGLGNPYPIAAAHKQGINSLMEAVLTPLFQKEGELFSSESPKYFQDERSIKIAVIGRPNVGKSTLINRILGYERVITFDQPGTTRDSIAIPFERDGKNYTLIDTAGIRRRARVEEVIEKFSIIKSLQSINNANVVLMLLDAHEGITEQDATILGMVLDSGCALVIAVNKWDGLTPDEREQVRYHLSRKLHFIDFAEIEFISALHGSGVGLLFKAINTAWEAAFSQIGTGQLNQALEEAVTAHPPPAIQGRRIKLRYIHQGGQNPPLFVIHGNQLMSLPKGYKSYLINFFRHRFGLQGTPIRLEFKQGENPYKEKTNVLTPRQLKRRQRVIRYAKK